MKKPYKTEFVFFHVAESQLEVESFVEEVVDFASGLGGHFEVGDTTDLVAGDVVEGTPLARELSDKSASQRPGCSAAGADDCV